MPESIIINHNPILKVTFYVFCLFYLYRLVSLSFNIGYNSNAFQKPYKKFNCI